MQKLNYGSELVSVASQNCISDTSELTFTRFFDETVRTVNPFDQQLTFDSVTSHRDFDAFFGCFVGF